MVTLQEYYKNNFYTITKITTKILQMYYKYTAIILQKYYINTTKIIKNTYKINTKYITKLLQKILQK